MHIETPRLLLRDLVQADAGPLASIWADPEVTRFMGGPRDGAQVRASLVEDASTPKQPDIDLRPVIEKATGAVIGDCGLLEKDVDGKERSSWCMCSRRMYGGGDTRRKWREPSKDTRSPNWAWSA